MKISSNTLSNFPPHIFPNLFRRLIGVSRVLVGEDVIESSTRSFLALGSVSSFRLYFRLHSRFDFIRFFSPLCCSLLIATRYHRPYLGEQQCVSIACTMCLLLYSESYSLLFSSLPRYHRPYLALIQHSRVSPALV